MNEPLSYRRTDRSLPIALLRARETVMAPIRDMLAESGISEQKWRVIRVLAEAGPLEQTHLAGRACLLLPSLTRIARAMEQDGLITRSVDKDDRRKSIVSITDKGRTILADHAQASAAIFESFSKRFGADRMEQLLDLLEELTAKVDRDTV